MRAIETGPNTRSTDHLGLINFPVATHLSRSQVAPIFSNKKEDWLDFTRKFDQWCRAISSGRALSDHENLQLLNSCLPQSLQKELQLWEVEKRRTPSYIEFRSYLEGKFGRAQSDMARKKWMQVEIARHMGKMTCQMVEEFRVNFKLALSQVPDITPSEISRVLMEKLPNFAKRWVAEAEAKKMRHQPILEVALDANMASGDVASSIETWIGVAPHRVEVRGGSVYLVHFRDEKVSNKLLEFNGRVLNTSKNRVRVRVVEQRMGMDDIFYEVITQMEIQEKTSALQKNAPSQDAYIRKAQRERRKGEDESESLFSGFGEGGGRPPSPPIRPPSQPSQVMPTSFGPTGGGCSTPRPAL